MPPLPSEEPWGRSPRDFYLGPYGSPESHEKYDRLIAEWLANGRQLLPIPEGGATGGDRPRLSVNERLLAYWRFDDVGILRQHFVTPEPQGGHKRGQFLSCEQARILMEVG